MFGFKQFVLYYLVFYIFKKLNSYCLFNPYKIMEININV